MLSKSINVISLLFAHRLTRQVRELYTSTLILDLAVSMIAIFEPVFLFVFFSKSLSLKGSLECVTLFYLGVYVLDFLLLPLGAKFARRYGYENSIALASVFSILVYFFLFSMKYFYPAVLLAIVAYAIAKIFYWPAYHANFARFSSDGEQGRELSNLYALESFVYVIGPLLGGLILEFYGFKVLFVIVSILILVSNIPMLVTKEEFEPKPFSYWDSFRRLFSKENGSRLISHLCYGEEWIVLVIWPVFMYLITKDFLGLGIISATSIFLSTAILLLAGRLSDKSDKRKILKYGTIFYFFNWLFKILVRGSLGVTIVDIYSRITKNFISLPITTGLYQEARQGSVMNSIVFYEMALIFSKIITMLLCLLLLQFFSPGWNSIFLLGAFFSVFYWFFKVR